MTMEELQAKMMRWSVASPKAVEKVLKTGAEIVRREAQEKHFRLPKMPRGESGGFYGSWLGSSEPRHPFWLRRSIAIDVRSKPGEFSARVGTNVPYGETHEYGLVDIRGVKMPERPFLRPSLAVHHERIFKMIEEANFSAYA